MPTAVLRRPQGGNRAETTRRVEPMGHTREAQQRDHMRDGIHPRRLIRSRRTFLVAASLLGAVMVAGCGGSSSSLNGRRRPQRVAPRRPPGRAPQPVVAAGARARPRQPPADRGRSRTPGACLSGRSDARLGGLFAGCRFSIRYGRSGARRNGLSARTRCSRLSAWFARESGHAPDPRPASAAISLLWAACERERCSADLAGAESPDGAA